MPSLKPFRTSSASLLAFSLSLWTSLASASSLGPAPLVLQTGSGSALNRVTIPIVVPTNYSSASVSFEVSFGTDERPIAGEFLDSFTVSLRNSDRTVVATVLTVDRFGATWRPVSPGAAEIPQRDLLFEPESGTTGFAFQENFTVRVELPPALLLQPAVMVLSLFDNQDQEASRAVISNLRVKLGLHSLLALESSAAAAGPYAPEAGVAFNRLRQTVQVPKAGFQRFFRLRGDTPSRLQRARRAGANFLLDYEADLGPVNLRLFGSNQPDGPFLPVKNASFNLSARTVSVPLFNAPGFFQIGGSHPARIVNDEVRGEFRVLEFDVRPVPPKLESSARVQGPYAEEASAISDAFAQRLTLPKHGLTRFYRLASELPLIIRHISSQGDDVLISYEEP